MTKPGDIAAAVLDAFLRGVPQDAFQIHEALDDLKLLASESADAVEAAREEVEDFQRELDELQYDKDNLEEELSEVRDELDDAKRELDELQEKFDEVDEQRSIYRGTLAALYGKVRPEATEPVVITDLEFAIRVAIETAEGFTHNPD